MAFITPLGLIRMTTLAQDVNNLVAQFVRMYSGTEDQIYVIRANLIWKI